MVLASSSVTRLHPKLQSDRRGIEFGGLTQPGYLQSLRCQPEEGQPTHFLTAMLACVDPYRADSPRLTTQATTVLPAQARVT